MGSSSCSSNSSWTPQQYRIFEDALALHDRDTPDRWQRIANVVGKSPEEVRKQYEILVEDIRNIESGRVPYPYRSTGHSR